MHKNKNQNRLETFGNKKTGYKNIVRNFAMAVVVMVFILGGGLYAYKKINKTEKVSQTQTTSTEIPGWWYQKYFGKSVCEDVVCKPSADPDSDDLTNSQEYFYHTDPLNTHTVGDELNDGQLVAAGFDPSRRGRMTFDQVLSEENVLGESLLLDADIKKMIAEDLNIDNVVLPLVKDDELKIIANADENVYKKYGEQVQKKVDEYFPDQRMDSIVKTLESGDDFALRDVRRRASDLSKELKAISVPKELLLFHKYNIVLYHLVSNVTDPAQIGSDAWFDDVQAMLAAQQRLSFEIKRLSLP